MRNSWEVNDTAARRAFVESKLWAAATGSGQAERHELAGVLAQGLFESGQILRVAGVISGTGRVEKVSPYSNGDDGLVEVGYLAEVAAELIESASQLLSNDHRYAAAALARQIVEVEYLMWVFANKPDEAGDWLRSDRQTRLAQWQPRHLRKRSDGRFDVTDYQRHCELGGHPTPDGARAFSAAPPEKEAVVVETLWYEICHHGANIWSAFQGVATEAQITLPAREGLDLTIGRWHETDELGPATKALRAL